MQEPLEMNQPMIYRVEDIQRLLGIGRNSAYNLIRQADFPSVRVGARVVVPADLFHAWVSRQAGKGDTGNGQG